MNELENVLLPTLEVAARYHVCPRTIERWADDHPALNFPKCIRIGPARRKFWKLGELVEFERSRNRGAA